MCYGGSRKCPSTVENHYICELAKDRLSKLVSTSPLRRGRLKSGRWRNELRVEKR